MPQTFQTIAVLAVALMPGAVYIWSFERVVGRWGVGLSDRILRFVGASALVHVLAAPVTYWFWAERWPGIEQREPQPLWTWALVVAYVGLPSVAGHVVGRGTLEGRRWTRYVSGPHPAPRAWDHLFQGRLDGWVRMRLVSGSWIGGAFVASEGGLTSYASGYPEEQDLFLATKVDVDPDTGEFRRDEAGRVQVTPGSILVRWGEVEYLEFIDR